MNHTRRVFVCLLGLVVILSILVFPVSAQGNDTGAGNNTENATANYENATSYPPQQNELDILAESQRGFDRSLSILNSITTMFGAMVGALAVLIALIIALAGGFGISEIKKWRSIREDIEKYKITIEKDAKVLRGIRIKAEKDADTERNEVKNILQADLTEEPSDKIRKKIDDFSNRIDTLELLGVSLKPEDYINRGTDLFYKKNYESALKAYDKAIELKKDYDLAWYNKGVTLGELGRHDEALVAYDKAIELKLDYAEAWYNKGVNLGNLSRYDKALEAYEKVTELKPNFADAWSNKAVTLRDLGRYEKALDASEKAIELKKDDASAYFNRACVHSLMGNKEKALSDLEKAIEFDASFKEKAKKDEDFKILWDDDDFKKLVE